MMTVHIDMTLKEANEFIESYGWVADNHGVKKPIERAEQRRSKLKKVYCSSGLCTNDYKEMMMLDKAISLVMG